MALTPDEMPRNFTLSHFFIACLKRVYLLKLGRLNGSRFINDTLFAVRAIITKKNLIIAQRRLFSLKSFGRPYIPVFPRERDKIRMKHN
jgi:hypothetical protein